MTATTMARCLPDDGYIDEIAIEQAAAGRRVRLTMRERQSVVERMTADGYSALEIAERLGCKPRTVCRRRSSR